MGTQFVVQLENRPGTLARLARALAERGVNIVRCAGGGAGDVGYATLETEDDQIAREVLHSIGLSFVEGVPLTIELQDRPGALADTAERLARAGIDILGLLLVGRRDATVLLALTTSDPAGARRVLGLD